MSSSTLLQAPTPATSATLGWYDLAPLAKGTVVGVTPEMARGADSANDLVVTKGHNLNGEIMNPEMIANMMTNRDLADTVINLYRSIVTITGIQGGDAGRRKIMALLSQVFEFRGFGVVPQSLAYLAAEVIKVVIPAFRASTGDTRPSGEVRVELRRFIYQHEELNNSPTIPWERFKGATGQQIVSSIVEGINERYIEALLQRVLGLVSQRCAVPKAFDRQIQNVPFEDFATVTYANIGIANRKTLTNIMPTLQKTLEQMSLPADTPPFDAILTTEGAVNALITGSPDNLEHIGGGSDGVWSEADILARKKNVNQPLIYPVPLRGENAGDMILPFLEEEALFFFSAIIPTSAEDPPKDYTHLYLGHAGGKKSTLTISTLIDNLAQDENLSLTFNKNDDLFGGKEKDIERSSEMAQYLCVGDLSASKVNIQGMLKALGNKVAEGSKDFLEAIGTIKAIVDRIDSYTTPAIAQLMLDANFRQFVVATAATNINDRRTAINNAQINLNRRTAGFRNAQAARDAAEAAQAYIPAAGDQNAISAAIRLNLAAIAGGSAAAVAAVEACAVASAAAVTRVAAIAAIGGEVTRLETAFGTALANLNAAQAALSTAENLPQTAQLSLDGGVTPASMKTMRGVISQELDTLPAPNGGGDDDNHTTRFKHFQNGVGLTSFTGLHLHAMFLDTSSRRALQQALGSFSGYVNRINAASNFPISKEMDPYGQKGDQCIENVYFAAMFPGHVPLWTTTDANVANTGANDNTELAGLGEQNSLLVHSLRGLTAPGGSSFATSWAKLVAYIPNNFVGTAASGHGAGRSQWEDIRALLMVATARMAEDSGGASANTFINANVVVADFRTIEPLTDNQGAAVTGATTPNGDEKRAQALAKLLNQLNDFLLDNGISRTSRSEISGKLNGLARMYEAVIVANATPNIGFAANAVVNRTGFAVHFNAAMGLMDGGNAQRRLRPANLNDLAAPGALIRNPPNYDVSSFFKALLTAIALHRGDTALGVRDHDTPATVRSNGKIVNHAETFSADGSMDAGVRLAIVMAKRSVKTLRIFNNSGIPLWGDILMLHPALIRGDPIYWVRRKLFTVMASVNEAFMSVDPDKRQWKPTMSGHVTVFCPDDAWSVCMNLAHVKSMGKYDLERPMNVEFFINPSVAKAGYIALFVEAGNAYPNFLSLTGFHTNKEIKAPGVMPHHTFGPHLVNKFKLQSGMFPGGRTMTSKAAGPNFKFPVNVNSIPCTFECRTRGGDVIKSPSTYVHGTIMETGGLNAYYSGILEVKVT